MSQELRQVIEAAEYAESEAIDALKNSQNPFEIENAMEALKTCVREIGWRWKDIAALIAERDALAEKARQQV